MHVIFGQLGKYKLYGKDAACLGPQSDSSGWDWGQVSNGRNGKRGELPFQ